MSRHMKCMKIPFEKLVALLKWIIIGYKKKIVLVIDGMFEEIKTFLECPVYYIFCVT